MGKVNFLGQITAWDDEKLETFKLILSTNQIISIAENTFEVFDDETGKFVEHKGCKVYIHDYCYKVLNSYEEFLNLIRPN